MTRTLTSDASGKPSLWSASFEPLPDEDKITGVSREPSDMMTIEKETFGSIDMVKLRKEHTRTYIYSDDREFTVEGVTHLHVTKKPGEGDSHRLRDTQGYMWYVASGWLAIKFEGLEGWTL